jgi:hypothetical protein
VELETEPTPKATIFFTLPSNSKEDEKIVAKKFSIYWVD